MPKVEAINISRKKGVVKKPVPVAEFRENFGIVDDAHAGDWHRQVSLLPLESIEKVRELIPNLADGAFAENIIVSGVEFGQIQIGSQLFIGEDILLEVTQIGKECHTGCAIRTITGDCIMPREGIFCRVIQGGQMQPGDKVKLGELAEVA